MFISRIKEFRIQRGWSQEELAKRVGISGVSQMTISNLERNLRDTTLSMIEEISEALGVCPRLLFFYECKDYDTCTSEEKIILNCCGVKEVNV